MAANERIGLRVSEDRKAEYEQAAAAIGLELTPWLLGAADARLAVQKGDYAGAALIYEVEPYGRKVAAEMTETLRETGVIGESESVAFATEPISPLAPPLAPSGPPVREFRGMDPKPESTKKGKR